MIRRSYSVIKYSLLPVRVLYHVGPTRYGDHLEKDGLEIRLVQKYTGKYIDTKYMATISHFSKIAKSNFAPRNMANHHSWNQPTSPRFVLSEKKQ